MAKEVIVRLRDDVDGSDATETVEFGYKGLNYEIDLSEENAFKLEAQIEEWIKHARRAEYQTTVRKAASAAKSPAKTDKAQLQAIRDWATKKGLAVSNRGRIRQEIVDQYNREAGVA